MQTVWTQIRPDILFGTLMVFLKEFFKKVDFEKIQQTTKKHEKLPSRLRVKNIILDLVSALCADHFQNPILSFENHVNPDQLASSEAS